MEAADYIAYLMSTPVGSSCIKASDILLVSHDEVNRFLLSGTYTGLDLFKSVCDSINLIGGTLSVDDSVLDKPYTQSGTTELVGYFWSGKHHKSVQGINLIVLVYTTCSGYSQPVNFRLYRAADKKTKNDYFQEMLKEVWHWGLRPKWVSADSWYSSLENLKFLRNLEVNILMGIESNRTVTLVPSVYQRVIEIDIPSKGVFVHLKGFDFVQVFRTVDTDGNVRHYAIYQIQDDLSQPQTISEDVFFEVKKQHWKVEEFFRTIKQCCQAQSFFVRKTQAIKTHLFCVIRAFQKLAAMALHHLVGSIYQLKTNLFRQAQREFIHHFA